MDIKEIGDGFCPYSITVYSPENDFILCKALEIMLLIYKCREMQDYTALMLFREQMEKAPMIQRRHIPETCKSIAELTTDFLPNWLDPETKKMFDLPRIWAKPQDKSGESHDA